MLMTTYHSERIRMLTQRAKEGSSKISDLDIGEIYYLKCLLEYIRSYRQKEISADDLLASQKVLEMKLEHYYMHCEMFDRAAEISNRYSEVLTEAEKHGCPICQKLVRIFDGREK